MGDERRYNERLDQLVAADAVPVTSNVDPDQSQAIAHALADGGISLVEFAARYDDVMDSIDAVASDPSYDGLVGVGSVQNADGADSAIAAGADFVVSHYAPDGVVATCHDQDVPVVLGAWTPTEIEELRTREYSPDIIKWYPAVGGGLETLDAITGPIPDEIPYLASGGITPENTAAYLEAGADAVAYGIDTPDDYAAVREEAEAFLAAADDAANTSPDQFDY